MEDHKNNENVDPHVQSRLEAISKPSGPWLHACHDPMAHLYASSQRIATVDITNDGNHALLVVDESKRLKVFRGMNLISSHKLLDHASCLSVFYPSSTPTNKNNYLHPPPSSTTTSLPAVGVATASNIYIYKSMRPYYKFSLPTIKINEDELKIWSECKKGTINHEEALQSLLQLQKKEIELSFRSMFILSITDNSERLRYIDSYKEAELQHNDCITCMTSIKKEHDESNAVSSLIIGTENNEIIFLDSTGAKIVHNIKIPSIPFKLSVIGLLSVDYRLLIATRSATIYTIRNGKLLGNHIQLESSISCMAAWNKNIVVGCINQTIYCYHMKGSNVKLYSLYFQHHITAIEPICGNKFQGKNYMLIGLDNGEIHLYNDNVEIHILALPQLSPITALRFGKYGREDHTLIILNKSGSLNIKIMSRRINLNDEYGNMQNNKLKETHNQQDIPLNLPPITQLYLDQDIREKENAENMHKIWQKEIVKFRLKTNKEYIKILNKGNNCISNNKYNLNLNVNVIGLGPLFTLQTDLVNTGNKVITNTIIIAMFDNIYYKINHPILQIPVLIPELNYNYKIKVQCIHASGDSKPIQLAIIDNNNIKNNTKYTNKSLYISTNTNHFPLMTAIVDMPLCDMEM